MISFKKTISLFLPAFATVLLAVPVFAQSTLKVPAPSPTQTLDQAFGLSNIKIEYSRPGMKGRKIFGDLVPYGKLWRTGANASTKITFGDSVNIEGKPLAPGTYALYTLPNKDIWDIIFYKDLTLGGNLSEFKAENEVLRVKVKPTAFPYNVETFTIQIGNFTNTSCMIKMVWETTLISINVTTDVDARIMKNIESAVVKDNRPYYTAANYYYENQKDLTKALEWVNKAVEANPKAYWVMHLKAKIQLKQKDYAGAIASAEKSKELAREDENDEYVTFNDKLIAEAKTGK